MSLDRKHELRELIGFGERLIMTEDLDPCYVAIDRAELPRQQVNRMLIAYFCFYHLGVAAWLSEREGAEFWGLMENAASNVIPPNMNGDLPGERWPRGSERRHFRGPKCVAAVEWLAARAPKQPERLIEELIGGAKSRTLAEVMERVSTWPLFGDWIGFKVADVLERVLGYPVVFPEDLTLIYKEPRAALDMLDIPAEEANNLLLKHFRKFKAPPRQDRPCGIAEVETVCCKTKSHWGGHYWIGKDIHEIRKGLRGWGKTADQLLKAMPFEVVREGQLHA